MTIFKYFQNTNIFFGRKYQQ